MAEFVVVILNCGEPEKIITNSKKLAGVRVVIAENVIISDDIDNDVIVDDDKFIVKVDTIKYQNDAAVWDDAADEFIEKEEEDDFV